MFDDFRRHPLDTTIGVLEAIPPNPAAGIAAGSIRIFSIVGVAGKNILISRSSLQHTFKHARDFGVAGHANNKTLKELSEKIHAHLMSPSTRAIKGTYRNRDVTHMVNPTTGINVIQDSAGNLISGWRLSSAQLQHVLNTGKLGGGK